MAILARNVGTGLDEEMRSLRDAARALDENQRKIGQSLGGSAGSPTGGSGLQAPEPPNPTEARRLASALRQQQEEAARLLQQLERLSTEAEPTAPLLSRKLYDGLREARMSDMEAALQSAGELLERNLADEARGNEARARRGIAQLRGQMDEAAKAVLGDEAGTLRAAQGELDSLLAEAGREGASPAAPPSRATAPAAPAQPGRRSRGRSGRTDHRAGLPDVRRTPARRGGPAGRQPAAQPGGRRARSSPVAAGGLEVPEQAPQRRADA